MKTLLTIAKEASERRDWSLVNQTLQQIPLPAEDEQIGFVILPLALEVLKQGNFQQRWEVSQFFPKLGKQVIPFLIEILHNQDVGIETRWFTGRILSQYSEPTAILALVQLLKAESTEELCRMASQGLAQIGASAIYPLIDLLETPATRLLTVQALAQIRRVDIIEPLLSVVNDPSPLIRSTAIEALGSFHDERIFVVLVKALQDPITNVRKEALQALGYSQAPDVVDQIKPLLGDINLEICQDAAIALGRIGSEQAAKELFTVLQSTLTPNLLKREIIKALGWMQTNQALDYLALELRKTDVVLCLEIITMLGRQELPTVQKQATEILLDFFNSQSPILENPQVKQRIATSLGEMRQASAKSLLLSLSEDNHAVVRLHAQAALKKFS